MLNTFGEIILSSFPTVSRRFSEFDANLIFNKKLSNNASNAFDKNNYALVFFFFNFFCSNIYTTFKRKKFTITR